MLLRHEIENYLLNADALHASRYHNRGRERDAIAARMVEKADTFCWCAACRATIAELKRRFREPFVADPKQAVVDESSARAHICGSPWFTKLASEAARSATRDVDTLLADNHADAVAQCLQGDWLREFAGKEILKDVGGWICDRTNINQFPKPEAEFYNDLAKGVASWQVKKTKFQKISRIFSSR